MKSVSEDLKNEIRRRLPEIPEGVYQTWDEEEEFINIAVRQLDNISGKAGNQSFRIQVREMHQSPYMDYNRPSHVSDKNPELADILYILNFFQSGQVLERRCSLTQAKFANISSDSIKDKQWNVEMHQYELLSRLEEMEFTWKGDDEEFTLDEYNRSFTTYVFASDRFQPFFQNTKRVNRYLYNRFTEKTYYTLPRKKPWGIDSYRSKLMSMISQEYGQPFSEGDKIYDFFEYMFEEQRKNTFTKGKSEPHIVDESGDPVPDGGSNKSLGPHVVFVDIGLDSNGFHQDTDEYPPDEPHEITKQLNKNKLKEIEYTGKDTTEYEEK